MARLQADTAFKSQRVGREVRSREDRNKTWMQVERLLWNNAFWQAPSRIENKLCYNFSSLIAKI